MLTFIFTVLPLAAIISGLWLMTKTLRFLKTAKLIEGKTMGTAGHLTIDMRTGSSSVIQYIVNNKPYIVESRIVTPFPKSKNKPVEVLYNPADPSDSVLNSPIELHLPWIILLGTGLMTLIPFLVFHYL